METAATNAVEAPVAQSDSTDTQVTESAPVETTETTQVAKVETPSEKEPEWFVKRIGEMTAKWRNDERRAIQAEQELVRLRQQQQQPAPVEKPKTLEDFGYDEGQYQTYLFQTAETRAVEAAKRVRVEEQEAVTRATRARKFQERQVAFEKETPDYREVAHYAPINDGVADLVQELESGPELAYYLGKHRDIALTLNDLPLPIAAIELGRIDARLSADKSAKAAALEKAKAEKAVTKAPPPAPNLEGSNAQVDKNPSDMTDAEFAKWRKRQIAQRRNS